MPACDPADGDDSTTAASTGMPLPATDGADDDGPPSEDTTGSPPADTDDDGDDEGVDDSDGADDGGDTTSGPDDGGGDAGSCALSCTTEADCCPPGAMDCPGDYPFNFSCDGGVCQAGGCADDSECADFIPGWVCLVNEGQSACGIPCAGDRDCMLGGLTCAGVDDNGVSFCAAEDTGCRTDEDCGGSGVCDAGACVCSSDADCSGDTVDICI
ncbi:MAG: hypothetical protein AAF721_05965 [Myxococcota bacterium]